MTTGDQTGLEGALERVETDIDSTLRASSGVARELKKAKTAAAVGAVRDLERALEVAVQLSGTLVDSVRSLRSGWQFDDRGHLESGAYLQELIEVGLSRGVKLFEQDGRIVSYPSLVRVLPAEAAVEIDRKRDRRLRPSVVVEHLRARQTRPVRFRAEQFLESLYRSYKLALADRRKQPGSVVSLNEVYGILTLLPGQSRDYSRPEFLRDIHLLDQSGVSRTRDGVTVSFPAATGTKGSGVLVAVTQGGALRHYYGIAFRQ